VQSVRSVKNWWTETLEKLNSHPLYIRGHRTRVKVRVCAILRAARVATVTFVTFGISVRRKWTFGKGAIP